MLPLCHASKPSNKVNLAIFHLFSRQVNFVCIALITAIVWQDFTGPLIRHSLPSFINVEHCDGLSMSCEKPDDTGPLTISTDFAVTVVVGSRQEVLGLCGGQHTCSRRKPLEEKPVGPSKQGRVTYRWHGWHSEEHTLPSNPPLIPLQRFSFSFNVFLLLIYICLFFFTPAFIYLVTHRSLNTALTIEVYRQLSYKCMLAITHTVGC